MGLLNSFPPGPILLPPWDLGVRGPHPKSRTEPPHTPRNQGFRPLDSPLFFNDLILTSRRSCWIHLGLAGRGQAPTFMHPVSTHVENSCVRKDPTGRPQAPAPALSRVWAGPGERLLAQCWGPVWDTLVSPSEVLPAVPQTPPFSLPSPRTCKEGHEQGHPAQDVRPGKAPVPEAATEEADCDAGVNGQGQQDEEGWEERVWVCYRDGVECGDAGA